MVALDRADHDVACARARATQRAGSTPVRFATGFWCSETDHWRPRD
jgi:hypothetical protein